VRFKVGATITSEEDDNLGTVLTVVVAALEEAGFTVEAVEVEEVPE
jgi:hypothetical protein